MIDRRRLNAAEEIEQLARNAELKRVMKEAIGEWLDAKFAEFSKWSVAGLVRLLIAALVAGALYMTLVANGWHKP